MKVLLVDDEIFTIRMLQSVIPWEKLGLKLVGYAQDGASAYEKVVTENPDIIISDIRMPEMDGLELLGKVRKYNPEIKLIMMSAYADFSYVKEGLKLGCSDYILKPVDETELEMALGKVIREIQGAKEQEQVISQSVKQMDHMNLYQYMRTGRRKNRILKLQNRQLWKEYVVFLIQVNSSTIDEYTGTASIEMGHEGYVNRILAQMAADWNELYEVFDYEDDCWIMILGHHELKSREEVSQEIIDRMLKEVGIRVKICFSSRGKSLDELPGLYEEIRNLSKYSFYVGDEDIFGYGYNCDKRELVEVRNVGIMKDVEQAIRNRNREAAYAALNEAFSLSFGKMPEEKTGICGLCYQLIQTAKIQLSASAGISGRYRKLFDVTYEELTSSATAEELKTRAMDALEAVFEAPEKKEEYGYSKTVSACIQLIEKRYNENISLEDICQEVSVSKNYFCYLFKRETGISIWNYLTGIRLQHAKKLLEETDLKSYEIAFRVGYDNPSYFSKIFKKYENVSPNEYREGRK